MLDTRNAEDTEFLKNVRIRQLKDYSEKKLSFIKLGVGIVIFAFLVGRFLNVDVLNLFIKTMGLQAIGYPLFSSNSGASAGVGTTLLGIKMAVLFAVTFFVMVRFFFLGASPTEQDALKELDERKWFLSNIGKNK